MRLLFTLLLLIISRGLFAQSSTGYHSIHFAYDGTDAKITQALKNADAILARPDLWQAIRAYPQQQIDNSTYTMTQLADTLQQKPCVAKVVYITGQFQSATAQTGGQPATITLQKPGYIQSPQNLTITFVHEWVHAVDFTLHARYVNNSWQEDLKFAHFYLPKKCQGMCPSRDTASYRVERIVVVMLGGDDYVTSCTDSPGVLRTFFGIKSCK